MRISEYTQGRDNNFNFIRILAAFAVLITHSFALAIGSGDAEPFRESLGMTMGTMAVDAFFITSGFLVTASLLKRQSTIEFIWSRVLRIFPALIAMVFITTLIIGPIFTSLDVFSYLTSPALYLYIAKCSTLFFGIAYDLPGVFTGNPYKDTVNGSLWTMPHEVRMYAILLFVWLYLKISRNTQQRKVKACITLLAITSGSLVFLEHFNVITEHKMVRLFFMFFYGSTFYALREHVNLDTTLFLVFSSAIAAATIHRDLFFIAYTLALPYIILYCSYVPSGRIRQYNRLGDYSYGIYVYAFPVQQVVAALFPGVSVYKMFILSTIITIPLAVVSWHLLEKNALKLKEHFVHRTKLLHVLLLAKKRA